VYQEDVLQGVVKTLNTTLFNGQEWVFQQHSATAQEPRHLRSCCRGSFWPSSEPRIGSKNTIPKPLDYGLWATYLKDMPCRKHHSNLERSPWRQCMWQKQNGQNVLSLRQGIGRPFWVTIL